MIGDLNILGIAFSALAAMIIGAVWCSSKLFGVPWRRPWE